jgi:hypothetical protein
VAGRGAGAHHRWRTSHALESTELAYEIGKAMAEVDRDGLLFMAGPLNRRTVDGTAVWFPNCSPRGRSAAHGDGDRRARRSAAVGYRQTR